MNKALSLGITLLAFGIPLTQAAASATASSKFIHYVEPGSTDNPLLKKMAKPIRFDDGSEIRFSRVERPQVALNEKMK